MNYETLQFEVRDHIGWLTLNRPASYNALTMTMIEELRDFFGALEDNLDTRVIVIRGAGKSFCAGLDLMEPPGYEDGGTMDSGVSSRFRPKGFAIPRKLSDVVIRMRHCPQPIIASIRGATVGGGFGIAMAADIRIVSDTAKFNVGAPRIGFSGGDVGISYFLPRQVGAARAALYMFTSRSIDAVTAERIGLVSLVVPDDQLDQATEDMTLELARISPFALRMTKEVYNAGIDAASLADATKLENRTQILCSFTSDSVEAIKASFIEKRAPVYTDE